MDIPIPKLSQGLVLVKVSKCGICGSDIRYFHGENPWAKQTLGRHIDNRPNMVLGHEFVGTVEDVFDKADAYMIGKRVGVLAFVGCGRCEYCRNNQEQLCEHTKHIGHGQGWQEMQFYPGAMAEYCVGFANHIYELPDNISDERAVLLDPLIVAIHAVKVSGVKPSDAVAISGAGPIGLLIAQVAGAYGAAKTIITDIAQENITAAQQVGIDHALNIADGSHTLYDFVMENTGGCGANIAFNTVGTSESIEESLKVVRKGGTVVLLATKEEQISLPSLLISGEKTIKTSSNCTYADYPDAVKMLAAGIIEVGPLITHRFELIDVVKAFEVACNKKNTGAIKIVINCKV